MKYLIGIPTKSVGLPEDHALAGQVESAAYDVNWQDGASRTCQWHGDPDRSAASRLGQFCERTLDLGSRPTGEEISKWATPGGVAHRFVAIAVANGR